MENQVSAFGEVLLFIIGAIIFVAGGLFTAWMVRPDRPNEEKLSTYECGEDPVGSAWGRFNVRFYVIALVFILFDVEIVFLFPWSVVFGQKDLIEQTGGLWGWFSLAEMFIFIAVLLLGLAYVWANGFLDWVKPKAEQVTHDSPVPDTLYDNLNRQYADKLTKDGAAR